MLIIICSISAFIGLAFIIMTREITFFSIGTDNQKQVYAASQSNKWRWPSDMHKFSGGKSYMKDIVILLLAGMQRIMKDSTTDYPLVSLCAVANSISATLVYSIAYNYFGLASALVIFSLYIGSFWPWQIALMGGHVCLAQAIFLSSIFFIQLANASSANLLIFWLIVAGTTFGFMQFSSASARKYVPLFLGAFLYSQRDYFMMGKISAIIPIAAISGVALLFLMLIVKLLYKPVISIVYHFQAPFGLNELIKNREKHDLEYYVSKGNDKLKGIEMTAIILFVYFVAYIGLLGWRSFYLAQIPVILGAGLAFLVLLSPNIMANLKGYLGYFNIASTFGHFRLYRKYYAEMGRPIKEDMRGAGLEWVIKYFIKVIPFQSLIYLFSSIAILMFGLADREKLLIGAIMILLSISPVLWGEITRGPQLGRSYFPGFVGQLTLIGYVSTLIGANTIYQSGSLILGILLVNVFWNLWIFYSDVYPARMAPAWLARTLKSLGVNKLHTYNTRFNDALVNTMHPEYLKKYEIVYITTIKEVEEAGAIVVIPGTSSKAFNMESQKEGYTGQDFRSDNYLNKLIDSRRIKDCAIASYKTFGTSKIWVHESEVSSYRGLILKDISKEDLWRGRAWVLSANKAKEVLNQL